MCRSRLILSLTPIAYLFCICLGTLLLFIVRDNCIKGVFNFQPIGFAKNTTLSTHVPIFDHEFQDKEDQVLIEEPWGSAGLPHFDIPKSQKDWKAQTDRPLFYFLHIPKTGGMTFNGLLKKLLPEWATRLPFRLDSNFVENSKTMQLFENRANMKEVLSGVDYVVGHSDKTLESLLNPKKVITVTILREPISKFISLYYFMLRNFNRMLCKYTFMEDPSKNRSEYCNILLDKNFGTDARRGAIKQFSQSQKHQFTSVDLMIGNSFPGFTTNTTLEEFLPMAIEQDMDNYMMRAFTGTTKYAIMNKRISLHVTPQMRVLEAKIYLQNLPFFGLTERYDESVELFLWTFNLTQTQDDPIPKRNSNPSSPVIDPKLIEKVNILEEYDIRLYDFSTKLFRARLNTMYQHKNQSKLTNSTSL